MLQGEATSPPSTQPMYRGGQPPLASSGALQICSDDGEYDFIVDEQVLATASRPPITARERTHQPTRNRIPHRPSLRRRPSTSADCWTS